MDRNYTTHSFSVELATKIGLEETLILQHFYYWCKGNADNPDMNKNNNVWVYISRRRILETYPYLTEKKVRNAIDYLKSNEYILVSNFNKLKIDKTNWYALTEKGYSFFNDSKDQNEASLALSSNDWSKSPTIGLKGQDIQDIKQSYNNKTIIEKEDTIVSSKVEENWRTSFAVYKALVEEGALKLKADKGNREYIEKFYKNADYDKSIEKMVEGFWGTEDGWKYCKKTRKGKVIDMYSALKRNLDDRRKIVYKTISTLPSKDSYQPKTTVPLHPSLKVLDNDGNLNDGTYTKNGFRYYFSEKNGLAVSVPPGAEPKPNGSCWEYDYADEEWYKYED